MPLLLRSFVTTAVPSLAKNVGRRGIAIRSSAESTLRGFRTAVSRTRSETGSTVPDLRRLSLRSLQPGEKVYLLKSLETGKEAVMVTRPYRLTSRERWSWVLGRVVETRSRRKRNPPQL
jgi:hypothetical protein